MTKMIKVPEAEAEILKVCHKQGVVSLGIFDFGYLLNRPQGERTRSALREDEENGLDRERVSE